MGNKKNIVSQELNRIKEKHGLTNESWANLSGVPKGTVNWYLSYNAGIPNYLAVCSLLTCVGESPEDFYASITKSTESAAELMNLAVGTEAKPDIQRDPYLVPSMQERINEQSEKLLDLQNAVHEQDAQLRVLRAENKALEDRLAEHEKIIAHRDSIISDKSRTIRFMGIFICIMIFVITYFLWEIINIDKGITALLYPGIN